MDLFADLPELSADNSHPLKNSTGETASEGSKTSDSLFGDLPDVSNGSGSEKRARERTKEDTDMVGNKRCRSSTEGILQLQGFFAERQGERDEMQDAHVIIDDFTSHVTSLHSSISRLAFYAVFDGHGGARASKFAAENFHKRLAERLPKGELQGVEKEMKKIFIEVYKKVDDEFLKQASKTKPSWKDGSTATTVLAINDTLYIANLGDSKAILCRQNAEGKLVGVTLTTDHNPTMYDERIRIQKAGGHVKDGRVLGQLEVSRSLGDGPYKAYGVSCVPDIKRCQLTERDKYLVLACDGVWKTFSNADCIETISRVLSSDQITATEVRSEREARFEAACSRVAGDAVKRLSADNVTIIIVAIGKS